MFWGVQHFRQYLLCKNFTIHTDCSALVKIFGPKNDLNGCAAGRLSRWATALMEFNFQVKHIRGSSNCTADSLSRLPIVTKGDVSAPFPDVENVDNLDLPASIKFIAADISTDVKYLAFYPNSNKTEFTIKQVIGDDTNTMAWDLLPLNAADVARETQTCKIYGKLFNAIKSGILDKTDKDLSKFQGSFSSLYILNNIIYFGSRICVPPKYQEQLLSELHTTHIGVVSMKKAVRGTIWWPGISKAIETICANCKGCIKYKKKPPNNTLTPWPFARRPMERVHCDFFEYNNQHILIMCDAFSKKIWCHLLKQDTTTATTLAVLYNWFCQETGLPTTLVSDNGPQFTSNLFKQYMKKWHIKHLVSPPYHPASNGLAERSVQTVKHRLKKMNVSNKTLDLYISLASICRIHGLTPHSSTDRCPYELIKLGGLPDLFPGLVPDSSQDQEHKLIRHSSNFSQNRRYFAEGEKVVVFDKFKGISYQAIISEILGNNTYLVLCENGTKHVSGDNISRDKSRAATVHPTGALPATAEPGPGNVDRSNSVDCDAESVTSDLSDDDISLYNSNNYDIVDDNVVNVDNQRVVPRELNHLGPIVGTPRLRSGRTW